MTAVEAVELQAMNVRFNTQDKVFTPCVCRDPLIMDKVTR